MSLFRLSLALFAVVALASPGSAGPLRVCTKYEVVKLNTRIEGSVLDFTFNHRVDRRMYSDALEEKRDLYIYLPPNYNPEERYPLMIWLHGFNQDEKNFLDIAPIFDKAIVDGRLPPMIVVAPDGSVMGRPSFFNTGGFYINSNAGRFEDYIATDVWNFVVTKFAVRPERQAHILAGASMGGFGAYNLGFKHRDRFGVLVGVFPPLNLRYSDRVRGYFAEFNPVTNILVDRIDPHSPIGRFYHGLVTVRQRRIIDPLFGRRGPEVIDRLSKENPIEMLELYQIKPGEFEMFIGCGLRDEFNIHAQVHSFVDAARKRGIEITQHEDPKGRHDSETGYRMFPILAEWAKPRIEPYAPKR